MQVGVQLLHKACLGYSEQQGPWDIKSIIEVSAIFSCAAVSRTDGSVSLMSGSTAAWVETVSTNVLGTALATREAVQASMSSCLRCTMLDRR